MAAASRNPAGPLQALAQPELMTIARTFPYPCARTFLHQITGAPTTWFRVVTTAAEASWEAAMIAKSSRPLDFIPQRTPAARKPPGSDM
jgi:hypothetical protein